MCPPQDTDQGGLSIGDSPGLLSGMLVLSCSADVNCDNGQELDFLVWLLPPRPLECEGDRARGPRTGEGKMESRPPPSKGAGVSDPRSSLVTERQAALKNPENSQFIWD